MKKFWGILLTITILAVVGMSKVAVSAKASWITGTKTLWTLVDSNGDVNQPSLYSTNITPGKNAYIWNYRHTKRIHNLKNYPNTTWYAVRGISKNRHFYYRIGNYNKTIKGLVWSGYVKKYVQKAPREFKTAAQFTHYIQTDPSQKLTRAVLKKFPNVPVSFALSKYAGQRFDLFPTSIDGFTDIVPISTLKLPAADFTAIQNYYSSVYTKSFSQQLQWYWALTLGQPVGPRADKVVEAMQFNGIDPAQFDDATANWKIGVNLNDGSSFSTFILAKQTD